MTNTTVNLPTRPHRIDYSVNKRKSVYDINYIWEVYW